MEKLSAFQMTVICAALVVLSSINLASGQLSTPCTTSMISTFTPCANFITGSSNNGSTPSASCCDSLRDLMKSSTACACMVITANVPIPLNRTLALSLPQACNMNGVPIQCQDTGSPLPASGPALLVPGGNIAPTLPPVATSPLSPQVMAVDAASKSEVLLEAAVPAPAPAPESTRVQAEAPTKSSRIRPVLTPAESNSASHVSFQHFLLVFIGLAIMIFGNY